MFLNSLFAKENPNVTILFLSVISFIGVTLVVDASVFGFGTDTVEFADDEEAVKYLKLEMLGIMFCFVYVIANSLSKFLETTYIMVLNRSQTFFFIEFYSVLLSSTLLMADPFIPDIQNEWIVYLCIPLLTLIQKFSLSKSYEHGIDFTVFIIIQSSIVFLTFLIDVYIFDKEVTFLNVAGGTIVLLASIIAVFVA